MRLPKPLLHFSASPLVGPVPLMKQHCLRKKLEQNDGSISVWLLLLWALRRSSLDLFGNHDLFVSPVTVGLLKAQLSFPVYSLMFSALGPISLSHDQICQG